MPFTHGGVLGKGHILGDDEKEKQVRRFARRYVLSGAGLAFLTIITVRPVFGLFWLPFWTLFYWWRVNILMQGCETAVRMSLFIMKPASNLITKNLIAQNILMDEGHADFSGQSDRERLLKTLL